MTAALPSSFYSVLGELATHQSRPWFHENRDRLRNTCEAPVLAVLHAVAEALNLRMLPFALESPKLFRLARDIRFSADKRPYKEHIAGTLPIAASEEGGALQQPAALYLHVGLQESMAGAGIYAFSPEMLEAWRARLLDESTGAPFAARVEELQAAGFGLAGIASLKRAPKGVDPAHPRIDLLRRKGLAVMFPPWPEGLEMDEAWPAWLADHAAMAAPVVAWIAACVPES